MSSISSLSIMYECSCSDLQEQGVGTSEPLEEHLAATIVEEVVDSCLDEEKLQKIAKAAASIGKDAAMKASYETALLDFRVAHCNEVVDLLSYLGEKVTGNTGATYLQAAQIVLMDEVHDIACRIQRVAPSFLGNLVYARAQADKEIQIGADFIDLAPSDSDTKK